MKVCFVQRIFAHYQGGLVKALAHSTRHQYTFRGDTKDPKSSGIKLFAFGSEMMYQPLKTWQWARHLAVQPGAIASALNPEYACLILEGSFTFPTNWLAILIAKLTGKRVLLYGHGWLRPDPFFKKHIRNFFFSLADGLLLYGNRAREFGIQSGFSPKKLYVVYNSLDYDEIVAQRDLVTEESCQELRRELFGESAEQPLLITVGRLTVEKRIDLLLSAANILKNRGYSVNIVLVGDGPTKPPLQEQAQDLGLSVCFLDAKYDEKLLSVYFSAADLTVIPGAAGLGVIHSLAYGTPVITHSDFDAQGPEVEAISPNQTGAFFQRENPDELADAILRTLTMLPKGFETYQRCIGIVDKLYNPKKMREIFDDAVDGNPAC